MPLLSDARFISLGGATANAAYLGDTLVWELDTTPFSPLKIPGMGLWVDPAQDTFIDGERVASYREHSPDQRTLTALAGQEPIFRAGAHPYLEFVSPAYGLSIPNSGFNAGSVGLTLVAVGHLTLGGQTSPMQLVVGPGMDGYEMRYSGSQLEVALSWQTSSVGWQHPTVEAISDKDYLHVVRIDVPGAKTDAWVNDVLGTGAAPTVMRNYADEQMHIGVRDGGYPYIGTISEALVYAGPISDSDLTRLTEYLSAKHGLNLTRRRR